ncbi:MAG: retroviral-like aspartic protease family protein [Nitrososphaerales archaeon]
MKLLVDTGATYTTIQEDLAEKLGVLKFPRKAKTTLADGTEISVEAGIAWIELKDRNAPITTLIMECKEPLLGVETLEALGLKVNPSTGELEPTRSYTLRA